jgi:signal transduction histidine kinase
MDKTAHLRRPVSGYKTPLCVVTPEGLIGSFNDAFSSFLDGGQDRVMGQSCREVFKCRKEYARECPLSKMKTRQQRQAFTVQRGDRLVEETAEPLFDDSGNMRAVLLSFADQSMTSSLLNDLTKIQKLETMAQTAGGAIHDLNNIFMCIDAEITLLKKALMQSDADGNIGDSLSSVLSALSKGRGLTHHLLNFTKGRDQKKEPTALESIIREAVSFSLLGSQLQSEVQVDSDLLPVETSAEQIFQLVSNLVINARQAINPDTGGRILVKARNAGNAAPGKCVEIIVEDEGHGIDPENINRIFEPFFTTKPDGTGLGLTLVDLIVKDLSGTIRLDSKPGKGTRFTINLPAIEMDAPSSGTD